MRTSEEGLLLAVREGDGLVVREANPLFAALFGLENRQLAGLRMDEVTALIGPRLEQGENFPEWAVTMGRIPDEPMVQELMLGHPARRVLRETISPATDGGGVVVGLFVRVRDITYDKSLEQQALHTQKMEGIGTLAGGIAHDFNNILTAILGYSSALKSDIESNKSALNKLDQIMRSAHRAADLTRNLLAFSRKNPHMPRVIDFNNLVRDAVSMLEFAMPDAISLKLDLAGDLPHVLADPAQMTQVITHLAVNARDAIFESGTIRFATRLGRDSQVDDDDEPVDYVVLDIEDDGVGIQKEYLSRIFEPFYTTKETGKGTGLGLAMVYGAVKQHYGFVEVESAPNMGSRFSIYLPATGGMPEEAGDVESEPPLAGDALARATILIVDDEEDIRMLCETAFESVCERVLTASDGEEGVRLYGENADSIDLVILDMTMPKMDGAECFERLRRIRADAPVMISSGYAREMGAEDLMGKGALGFIEKPYTMAKLVHEVEQLLRSRQDQPDPEVAGR